MPFQVKIFTNGKVTVTGAVRTVEHVTVSPSSLAALRTLATAEGFFTMRAHTVCYSKVGGLSTNYIRVRIGKRERTVTAAGGCNRRFVGLFEVLSAVSGVSTPPRSP